MKMATIAIFLGLLVIGHADADDLPPTSEGWRCFATGDAFFDAEVKIDDVKINNFIYRESASLLPPAAVKPPMDNTLYLDYSLTNQGERDALVDVQIAAFDKNNNLMFVLRHRVLDAYAGATATAEARSFIRKGASDQTKQFCVFVRAAQAVPANSRDIRTLR